MTIAAAVGLVYDVCMIKRLAERFGQHRLLGGAFVLAVTQFAASVAGLVRDRTLAATYPGLDVVDVYIASFRPADLLFQVLVMSGIATVLVPLFSKHMAHDRREDADRLLTSVLAVGSIVFGFCAVVLAIFLPQLSGLLVGFEGASKDLYIDMARLALLSNGLFLFGNAGGQYLVTRQRYWIYGLTPVVYTLGTIGGTVFLHEQYGGYAPMIGSLIGDVIYVLLRLGACLRLGFRFRWAGFLHPDVLTMGWLMLPRMAALGALQLQLLVFDALASRLDGGAVTINAYTRNFASVAVGVIGIALAQSAFSPLSHAAAKGERERFFVYLKRGTWWMIGLTIPAAVALVILTPVAQWLVHIDTAFTALFASMILFYALSIPFESLNHLYLRAFYARHNTAIPAAMSVLNGAVAIAVAWVLLARIGPVALPIGFVAGQALSFVGLALYLGNTEGKKLV